MLVKGIFSFSYNVFKRPFMVVNSRDCVVSGLRFIAFAFICPSIEKFGIYCFTVVHLSVRLSEHENLTFSHYS